MLPRDKDAVLYSNGLYSDKEMELARQLKISWEDEAKKDPNSAQCVENLFILAPRSIKIYSMMFSFFSVRVVSAMNKTAFKGYCLKAP